jgi:hypothetical protein
MSRDLERELSKYKKRLGLGFTGNKFYAQISFVNPQSIPAFIFSNTANHVSNVDGNPEHSSKRLWDGNDFEGIVRSISLPGYTLSPSVETQANQVFATKATKESLVTMDFFNDQWDNSYQFFRNWMVWIGDTRTLRYADEYMCNITCQIVDVSSNKILKTYVFYRCWPTKLPDVTLSHENKSLQNFQIPFSYEDFQVLVNPIKSLPLPKSDPAQKK